ncbi:MAG: hypothetical protein AAGA95_06835, partial [Pseudomonadota bacterium]
HHGNAAPFESVDGDDATSPLRALQEDGFVEVGADGIAITETGRYALHQLWGDASPSYRWNSLI